MLGGNKVPMPTREAQRAYQREWIAERRAEWIRENGPCTLCGSDEDLEVDHENPADKKIPVRSLWGMSPTNPCRIAELAKCRVLCKVCHLKKSSTEKARGVKNGQAKLTVAQAAQIRESTESWGKIGHLFPVCKTQFYLVRRGEDFAV